MNRASPPLEQISATLADTSARQLHEWVPPVKDERGRLVQECPETVRYQDLVPVDQELPEARVALANLEAGVAFAIESIERQDPINVRAIVGAIDELVASTIRNPDPAIGLAIGRRQDHYTLRHCVNLAVWTVALGRQLGLPRADLRLLGTGAALCDMGRERLPRKLLQRAGQLSPWELEVIREHVSFSLELIPADELDAAVIAMVAQHHEHLDGSGYPNAMSGKKIDLYARIARISDCFEAMITRRPYREPQPISQAVKELYALRGTHFQKELVESLISAIGIYPAGASVELSSGEAGIVIGGSRRNHLKPAVWLMLDAHRLRLPRPNALNLATDRLERQIVRDYPEGELGFGARVFFC